MCSTPIMMMEVRPVIPAPVIGGITIKSTIRVAKSSVTEAAISAVVGVIVLFGP
jgi:hypothetical protein